MSTVTSYTPSYNTRSASMILKEQIMENFSSAITWNSLPNVSKGTKIMQCVYENIAYISTHFATFCQLCKLKEIIREP